MIPPFVCVSNKKDIFETADFHYSISIKHFSASIIKA